MSIYELARMIRKMNSGVVIGVEGKDDAEWLSIKDAELASLEFPKEFVYDKKKGCLYSNDGIAYKIIVYKH